MGNETIIGTIVKYLEGDVEELKQGSKTLNKDLVEIKLSNVRTEGDLKQALKTLAILEENSTIGLERSAEYEQIVVNLSKEVEQVKDKVEIIEALPIESARVAAANAKKLRILIIQFLLSSGVALLVGLYKLVAWLVNLYQNTNI